MSLQTTMRRAAFALITVVLSACGGGGSGQTASPIVPQTLPAPQGAATPLGSASTSPSPDGSSPAPASAAASSMFSVSGPIQDVYTNGFLIQAGPGCGYIKIITSSSTTVAANGLTIQKGVYARAWGSGSCANQVTASAVSLASSANGPFPLPSGVPSPGASASPAPGATPSGTAVTGQIHDVYSDGFLIQTGTCGYLKVFTSSSTAIDANGLSIKSGVWARAWGSGSCSTQIVASTVSLASSANGPFPTPGGASPGPSGASTAAPVGAPTAAPTVAPASGISNAFDGIVNGQPWPASFRPYSQRPWNNQLPASPQNIDSANSSRLAAYLQHTETSAFADSSSQDFSHPVYFASNSDPVVSFSCGSAMYGCNQPFSSLHIPAAARPAGASDHHMAVVQPDGTEYDFWGASYNGGSTLSASIGAVSSITGNGVPTSESATSGASLAAGIIRFDELSRGVIPHALFIVLPCTNNYQFPGTTNAFSCPDGAGVPVGAHLYLAMSDSQIDALPSSVVPAPERPILHALHQYGGIVEDTGCSGNGTESSGYPCVVYESPTQYTSFGKPFPGDAYGAANGYAQSGTGTWTRTGISWPALQPSMQVLSGCYDAGSCSN